LKSNDYYNQFRQYPSLIIQQIRHNIRQQQQLSKRGYDLNQSTIRHGIEQLLLGKSVVGRRNTRNI
jgi:hypothetical protein